MSKHTEGDWFVAEHSWNASSVYAKSKTVCKLTISEEDVTEETQGEMTAEMNANARLIAAAPMMLEALRLVKLSGKKSMSAIAWQAVEAAIIAAKGGE